MDVSHCETVKTEEFAAKLDLKILTAPENSTLSLRTVNINRPGLQLAGYYDHFVQQRIQVMGEIEFSYLKTFDPFIRRAAIEKYYAYEFPCLIISTGLKPFPEMLELAARHRKIILQSDKPTTRLINDLVMYLNDLLAPMETRHGVLVDLFGVGVLISGQSGIGKSETALELVQRGHRLVADDAVIIKQINDRLIGSSPDIIRHFMEVRGIGIVDIKYMYGIGAVKLSKVLDMVVELEYWREDKEYDRLGVGQDYENILGKNIPKITIPVRPGRNLAVILESAARNQKLKFWGYDTLAELAKRSQG